ncbi:MAG TPA: Gfo/Idh/MocA family oxidoreductase [Ktedonobacteraceae bacterium]|jgi:predicted dehydrogenase
MQINDRSTTPPIRWGILGAANIAVNAVAPAIQASSNGQLRAVGSRDVQRAAERFSFAPDLQIYDAYEKVIADPEIDAIYIPLPNEMHAEWTMRALEAGKHVLCEKPLAITAEDGARMLEVAQKQGRLLMEAFMYRFHPQTIWALAQVHRGEIGQVRLVRASFAFNIRSHPENIRLSAELAGGALMDVGCYGVNICRAIYEQPPQVVAARMHVPHAASVDLATNAILDFGDGRYGMVDCSFEQPMRQSVEIIGEEGIITLPVPFTPGKAEVVVFATKNGRMNERPFPKIDQYQLEVEHFAECIRTHQEPTLRLSETLENIMTMEAIFEAAGQDWPIV